MEANNIVQKNSINLALSEPEFFPSIENEIQSFRKPEFLSLNLRKRFKQINQTLCKLILQSPPEAFLLSAVLNYFERVDQEKILKEPLNFTSFEFWLNHFSEYSKEENYKIRAKIIGKHLPRNDYQIFFPIGMGRTYSGTHFVSAHLSPDVDTMIASFWGWVDAFGARVGTGLHLWSLPGGAPDSPITTIFKGLFGSGVLNYLPRNSQSLTLTAMDLLTQKNFIRENGDKSINEINHGSVDQAIVLINETGNYLGDWRSSDLELILQVTNLFKSCLHWFENNLHTQLIALFSKENLTTKDLSFFYSSIFDKEISLALPFQDFTENQQLVLDRFLKQILSMEKGVKGTFRELNASMNALEIEEPLNFQKELESLQITPLFDEKGSLKESRSLIFTHLQQLLIQLDQAILKIRKYIERLDVSIDIKYKVLAKPNHIINLDSDVDEMRYKMQNYNYLTVVIREQDNSLFPVGVVRVNDLRETGLGTVSFRDFCNFEEVKMASYLEVISIIDHHKSSLKTVSVPTALIGDAQSCNTLIAEQTFVLNDRYSLTGLSTNEITKQLKALSGDLSSPSKYRLFQRLLNKQMISQSKEDFYIHPKREFSEYLSFLHAILDDTDLLTKVSQRDIECVAQLLNRLKTLSLKEEVEIIHFDDIPQDDFFTKKATQRILQQPDMYSLYHQVHQVKESEIETNLQFCAQGKYSTIFLDTKEQNGCARVGQTKLFGSNFSSYMKYRDEIRQQWLKKSLEVHKNKPEIDLYIHMISTVAGADEVYQNQIGPYSHQDELWFWIPSTLQGYNHLDSFLGGFQEKTKEFHSSMTLEFFGDDPEEIQRAFLRSLPDVPQKISKNKYSAPLVVLTFKAGALNSRKAMISPCLPRLIS
ncbi:MAG: hypothetical protein Q8K60_09870 [Parachlamydiaceae bacterium]|nr:hypothetical protein [Parachlamydiaceae bacterium]